MIPSTYKELLSQKSVIRELFAFATNRGAQIGYENVFDYSLGNPSVPTPASFTHTLKTLIEENDPVTLHGYSPTLGILSVRSAIAKSLQKRFNLPYKSENIFMTTGAAGAVAHALRAVTAPDEEVILFAPLFPEYFQYVGRTGAKIKVISPDLESFQINFDELERTINEKTAAVLINSPNNPSGVVYSTKTMTRLAEILTEKEKEYGHAIYIISDEPYREIVFCKTDAPFCAGFHKHSIICYSFSKSLSLPGERIGYVATNPHDDDGEMIVEICGQISRGIGHNCPPSLIQLAIVNSLYDTSDLTVYEQNAQLLYDCLSELGFTCVKPQGTFYIFPKALEEDANAFSKKALKYDLILVPGDSFCAPGYFRMAYCIQKEKVERSIPRLREFVRKEYK